MDNYVNIYKERGYYRVVLNVGATRMLNTKEICFDKNNFVMRMPTIYDNKVYKIANERTKNGVFTFTLGQGEDEDVVGRYTIEKDGDDFIMTKE